MAKRPDNRRYARQLKLPTAPFADAAINNDYLLICEAIAKRRTHEVKDFLERNAPRALARLLAHAGAKAPAAPAASIFEAEPDAWVQWLLSLDALKPPPDKLLDYLVRIARRLDREAVDRAKPLQSLKWSEFRSGTGIDVSETPKARPLILIARPPPPTKGSDKSDLQRRTLLAIHAEGEGERALTLYRDALLDADGQPSVDFDEDALGALESIDLAGDWPELAARIEAAWQAAFGLELHESGALWGDGAPRLRCDVVDAAATRPSGLVELYEDLARSARRPPLLHTLLHGTSAAPLDLAAATAFLGHMDECAPKGRTAIALDPSQRRAAVACAAPARQRRHALTAINGPPGTGKTSVLRAVIASYWVQDAVAGAAAPRRLWATGSTNKSVRNIIEAFGRIADPSHQGLYARWLDGLPSYGWFAAAASAAADGQHLMLAVHEKADTGDKGRRWTAKGAAAAFAGVLEAGVDAAIETYLTRAAPVLNRVPHDLDAVVGALGKTIQQHAAEMQASHVAFDALVRGYLPRREALRGLRQANVSRQALAITRRDARIAALDTSIAEETAALADLQAALRARREWGRHWSRRLPEAIRRRLWPRTARTLEALEARARAHARGDNPHDLLAAHAARARALEALRERRDDEAKARAREASALKTLQAAVQERRDYLRRTHQVLGPRAGPALRALRLSIARTELTGETQWAWCEHQQQLDRTFRIGLFHLAARYWEGRFLQAWRTSAQQGDATPFDAAGFSAFFMLAPVVVATTKRCIHLLSAGEGVDAMILDEAGQCPAHEAVALLCRAEQAIVVGDLEQLQPIESMTRATSLLTAAGAGITPAQLPDALCAHRGSAMRLAHRATATTERRSKGLHPGITLRIHYRCRPEIIAFCNKLRYEGTMTPHRRPRIPGDGSPAPMSWVDVRGDVQPQGKSWRNDAEADEIARWLRASHADLVARYRKPLHEVVAILTPLKAQTEVIRAAVAKALASELSPEAISRLTIGTVHALQGDERHVVAFSLVQSRPAGSDRLFADRDGGHLLNVAVSRAKDEFIIFADARELRPREGDAKHPDDAPVARLGRYLRTEGVRRYPQQLLVIEAPGKRRLVETALGIDVAVLPTQGHVAALAGIDSAGRWRWDWQLPEGLEAEVRERWRDLPELVIATDDDLAGERIGWHLAERLLASMPGARVTRMRAHAYEEDDLRRAFAARGHRFDPAMLRAALVREALHHERRAVEAAKLGHRAPQLALRALVEWLADAQADPRWCVEATLEQGQARWRAFIPEGQGTASAPRAFDAADAQAAARAISGADVVFSPAGPALMQAALPYPASTTARVLAVAAAELGTPPWVAQAHLNAMYLEGAQRGA